MAEFEDEFAKGEREAARLRARMEAALKRAEAFERQAQKDANYKRRLRDEARRGEVPGETRAAPREQLETRSPAEQAEFNRRLRTGRYGSVTRDAQMERQALSARKYEESLTRGAAAERKMGTEAVKLNRGLSDSLYIQGQANNQYQRFGALSSEWIGATRRGATTIGELGRQTSVTIGKFGGWLVAGSLLYTALGAVRAIGKGAIDSASGVNQLQRVVGNVDPHTVQGGFRQRAEKFNLPIDQVSEAAYEMGKIFHDQNDALEASDAVLYSVKVGELGVAESARYLTAITRGFNLEAKDTPGIFDQINAAQNRFGISISDVEAGLAKAAGTFRASGGEFSELLAIITTAQKVTGQTGQVVGTAIARAPNFLRQKKNKRLLEQFGIDSAAPINQIIEEAFKAAQGLSGTKLQELAAGIFGPQYGARIGTPLLQNYDLYKEVLGRTSPESAKGSAQRELNTLLGSFSELLTKIITELEIMGSELYQAGFLDIFGEGVVLLDRMLSGVNDLLDLFNQLPAPLTHTLAILAEMYAVIRVLRHFNVGESFGGKGGGYLGNLLTSPNQFKKLYGEDLHGQNEALIEERNRAATSVSRAQIGLNAAVQRQTVADREFQTLRATQGDLAASTLAQQENLLRAEAAVTAAKERVLQAELAEMEILTAQVVVEEKKAALAGARNTAEAEALAARYGDSVSQTFHRPLTGAEAARERGLGVEKDAAGNISLVPLGAAEQERVAQEAAATAKRQSVLRASLSRTGASYKTLAQSSVNVLHPIRSIRAAGPQLAESAALTAASAETAARSAIPAAGRGIGKLAGGLRGLASSGYAFLGGPIGLLIGGAFAAFEFGDDLGRALAGGQQQIERAEAAIKNRPTSITDLRKKLAPYSKYTDQQLERGPQGLGSQFSVPGAEKGFNAQRALEYRRLLRAQNEAIQRGSVATFLKPDQLEGQIEGLKNYRQGSKGFIDKFRVVQEEVRKADKDADPKAFKAAKKKLEDLGAKAINTSLAVSDYFGQFADLGNKKLLKQIEAYTSITGGGEAFGSQKDLKTLINRTLVYGVRNLQSKKAKQRGEGIEQLQALPQSLIQYGKEELETSLSLARNQRQTDKAYDRYLGIQRQARSTLLKDIGGERRGLKSKLAETLKDLRKLEKDPAAQALSAQDAKHFGIPGGARKEDPRIKQLRDRAKSIRKTIDNLDKTQKFELRQLNAAIREARLEQVHEQIDLYETRSQIREAKIGDEHPVQQAQQAVTAAQHVLSLLRGAGANQKEVSEAVLSLVQARQSLRDAITQEAKDLLDANAALAEARAGGDPVVEAQAQIDRARGELNLAKNEAERKQALANLISAQHQLDEAYAQIAIARIGLRVASTEDPVKQAALKIRQAELELKNAKGKAAQLEARTQKREAVKEKRDAASSKRIENIEFDAELEKITREQEIAAFERLLKTMDLGREARKDLRRKIHNLKKEAEGETGEFELNVGNIQLPTIYDIRRAVGGGAASGGQTVVYQDNSTNTVHAQVNGDNPGEVLTLMSNSFNRHNRNARRSAGRSRR